jgi:hypothetical protein
MKETDIFEQLDQLYAKKVSRIEKMAQAVVARLLEQQSSDMSAVRKAIAELRSILNEAKSLLKAAKDAHNRLSLRRGSAKR